ncbi:MAG TPA: SDR family oxidoreductase [Acidimicrobiia bacterium]|nr:SDR family oxidoreductase [Acidimicrobiia bacterium]
MKLTDRVYLVTGAAGGIGEGIAAAILEEGGQVALLDLSQSAVEAACSRLDPDGTRTLAVRGDVTSTEDAEAAVDAALGHFGRLDGVVNNAGVVTLDTAWDATPEAWEREFAVNVTGTFVVSQAVGRHLRQHGGGAIVNVASNCGKVGYKNMAGYNASKAAVINMTRSLALEWATDGINVNAVCPGGVDTPMLAGVAEWLSPRLDVPADDLLAGMGPAQLGRKVQPIEVGRVVAFLLSDAAVVIRGQAVNVDGGDTPY